ncbi:NADP-dependent 3-hydroxy acid dehydrogenase YdfG [Chitinophaga sp. CF118]|uniref:SDR family oxidoreductase n=1 Tax=Chitinophaga sp. CF118 TaxID=1884367 RepID=UPI0008E51D55|nr:SDR family oxidoreductase [Chitinophaga sp. CF118]SFD75378.1 NADP-dependent 3-hydroxy acid dehydrogenase YdfG [Chitinophaga sp. CF118]
MSNKVWFVTGASKGLGLTLTKRLLTEGYKVAATSRTADALIKAVGTSDNFLPLEVTLTDENSVQKGITDTLKKFGTIDVIVNNAGYGQFGTLEELSDAEVRRNFDINVFGSLNVIRQVMPFLREQRSGRIFNISSIGGLFGNFPGWGSYCATKFAVVGFTEALAAEGKEYGISATVVYPGYFRTEFLSSESLALPAKQVDAYHEAKISLAAHQNEISGNQAGDPEKASALLIKIASEPDQPLHLILGQDAYNLAEVKIDALKKDMEQMKAAAVATAF